MAGLTVFLSTFNRAGTLRKTLEAFCEVEREGLDVEFVVVDNNSNDDTSAVIQAFMSRLPLRYLKESRPGKNCALNLALDSVTLKEISVFTDDDVTPKRDWFYQMIAACGRWPEYSVFGGKVNVDWPNNQDPSTWCDAQWLQAICFVRHEYGSVDEPYPDGEFPFGPNFWVRSRVFDNGLRFNERLGPRPTKRLMGSETSFLISLFRLGYRAMFVPSACVKHRVQPAEVSKKAVLRRVYRAGRTQPYLKQLKDPENFRISFFLQLIELAHGVVSVLLSFLPGDESKRFSSRCGGVVRIGSAKESIGLVLRKNDFA